MVLTRPALLCPALLAGLAATAAPVSASPFTEVTSAFDPDDRFDLRASLHYRFSTRSASIKREMSGFGGTQPDDPLPLVKDLVYHSSRHELVPQLELGIFTDLFLTFELPIIIRDTRSLDFDQRADPCIFPGDTGTPTCINQDNSSTVQDGILPETGFDANDPTGPGFTDPSSAMMFRGPTRSGLDQARLGIGWAPMNQDRDDTKPTWKVGAEVRISVGRVMKFDRNDPSRQSGTSRGVHEVKLWTTMAKRVKWAEPYLDIWYVAPVGVRRGAPLRPPAEEFGAQSTRPQHSAGTTFGLEGIAYEKRSERLRIGVDLHATFDAHFEGRGYSEMWEPFAYAGDVGAGGPLVLDSDPTTDGVQAMAHTGVSNIENYMTVSGTLGVDAQVGERVRFGAGLTLFAQQSHLISFADAGVDLPTCTGGQTTGCEMTSDDVVTPGTAEVSPLHAETIDVAGHRYRVDEGRAFIFSVNGRFLF